MKCTSSKYSKSQSDSKHLDLYQKFPTKGILKQNLNKSLNSIKEILKSEKPTFIYSYVLTSVKNYNNMFYQVGSAPNFQGDNITLCTCMHHMRCFIERTNWENNVWIAGVTGSEYSIENNFLFYLMKVARAFPSQYDLWFSNQITNTDRLKKSSFKNVLGDLYFPKSKIIKNKLDPNEYHKPILSHSHRKNKLDYNWEFDIKYKHTKYLRDQSFLLGNQNLTFIWSRPIIKIKYRDEDNEVVNHPRTKRYNSINSFLKIIDVV